VSGLQTALDGKQPSSGSAYNLGNASGGWTALTPTEEAAVKSGINSTKVAAYEAYATNKQDALSGTGYVKMNGTTVSYDNSTFVDTTSNQSVGGTKTFTASPVVPTKSTAATNTGTAIATEAQVYLKQDKIAATGASSTVGVAIGYSGTEGTFQEATKLGTANVGSTTTPIYLNGGQPTIIGGGVAIGSASTPVYIASSGAITAGETIPFLITKCECTNATTIVLQANRGGGTLSFKRWSTNTSLTISPTTITNANTDTTITISTSGFDATAGDLNIRYY